MTEQSENLVLEILRGMRSDMAEMRSEIADLRTDVITINHKIGAMAQTLISVQQEVHATRQGVATLAIAVDEHTHRLDRIERKLGLINA